jgi:hypothetical protein
MQTNQPISLEAFTDFKCPAPVRVIGQMPRTCNGDEFRPLVRLKTYKGLMSSGKTMIAQIQIFECVACGAIHDLTPEK